MNEYLLLLLEFHHVRWRDLLKVVFGSLSRVNSVKRYDFPAKLLRGKMSYFDLGPACENLVLLSEKRKHRSFLSRTLMKLPGQLDMAEVFLD